MKYKFFVMFIFIIFLIGLVSSESNSLGIFKQNNCISLRQICNCTYVNISSVTYPDSTQALNMVSMTKLRTEFNYTFCNTTQLGTYTVNGFGDDSGEQSIFIYDFEITPSGTIVSDTGQVSIGILYFLVIIGFGLIFLGFLFLNKENIWTNALGIFLMCLGFIFIYYDLHLSNLYATTIAINSGAGNTTTGTFVMISRLLKLTPYLVSLIVVGVVIKLYRNHKKKKENIDGWDSNKF